MANSLDNAALDNAALDNAALDNAALDRALTKPERRLRILTLNHHESYLGLLAKTGHHFDVIVNYKGLDLSWSADRTPPPLNMTLLNFDATIKGRLQQGYYDVIICHTLKNLLWFFPFFRNHFIFIAHIPLFFYSPAMLVKSYAKRALLWLFSTFHPTTIVAISPFKATTWGLTRPRVIEPTPLAFPPAKEQAHYDKVVVVANHLPQRGAELGWPVIAKLLERFPITVLGLNPGLAASRRYASFTDFQEALTDFRIYLYTIPRPYGDGYNLSLLEAMSMGMAVVTLANPSSPIIHNINGLIAEHEDDLAKHLDHLLHSPAEVERLGRQAQLTVGQRFSADHFLAKWQAALLAASRQQHIAGSQAELPIK